MKTEVALGIDIGGTNTAIGFIDREGYLLAEGHIPTQEHADFNLYLKELHTEIERTYDKIRDEATLIGIGAGAPNGNYYNGTIGFTPNLPWEGTIEFCKLLKEYYDLPVFLNNDANAAAIGEMIYGGAKGMKNFIVITLGTGLGSGIVVNGEVLYGAHGVAGEVGHVIVRPGGRQCGCGRKGCLETYVSATGVKRTVYKMLAKYNLDSKLRDVPFNELNAKMVHQSALEGDKIGIETFKYTGNILGEALANVVAITNPEAIFLFGGLAKAGDFIINPTRQAFENNLLKIYKNNVKLLPSGLIANAAILGASAMVWENKEKNISI
jgi:glucokinase